MRKWNKDGLLYKKVYRDEVKMSDLIHLFGAGLTKFQRKVLKHTKLDIVYIDMTLLHHPGEGDVEAYHAMEKAVADGIRRKCLILN